MGMLGNNIPIVNVTKTNNQLTTTVTLSMILLRIQINYVLFLGLRKLNFFHLKSPPYNINVA